MTEPGQNELPTGKPTTRLLKHSAITGIVAAASMVGAQAAHNPPHLPPPTPEQTTHQDLQTTMPFDEQYQNLVKPLPQSTNLNLTGNKGTTVEYTIQKTDKEEINLIKKQMEKFQGIFNEKDTEDIQMYYPIYKAVANAYGVDWRLLWVIHDQETRCSRMPETGIEQHAVDKDNTGKVILENWTIGAMQRDDKIYPDAYAEEALTSKGLEQLKQIPTRDKNDAREIAFAGRKISEDLKTTNGDLLGTLKRYSSRYNAVKRWQNYNAYVAYIPQIKPRS